MSTGLGILSRKANSLRLTGESHLGKDQQIKVLYFLRVHAIENPVSAVEVVLNVAHLRGELETADPHLEGSMESSICDL